MDVSFPFWPCKSDIIFYPLHFYFKLKQMVVTFCEVIITRHSRVQFIVNFCSCLLYCPLLFVDLDYISEVS